MDNSLFPQIARSISDFIEDQDGNIPRGKLLSIGTLLVLFSAIFAIDAYAAHSSHSSHKSHSSHSSSSYHRSHVSHTSHTSATHSNYHGSHSSHSSHTSHSNTAMHSNSNYSAAGDSLTPAAPRANSITGIGGSAASTPTVEYPVVALDISPPEPTMVADVMPALAVPLDTPAVSINSDISIKTPPDSPVVIEKSE